METHLYLLCYRTEALVASHLPPEQFGAYMAVGTQKHTFGNVFFFEIDPSLRISELNLHLLQERFVPHDDGSPRRSKYMSVYRVMEHVPKQAFGRLFLTTRDGCVLGLEKSPCPHFPAAGRFYMYAELCPVTPRVVSRLNPIEFAHYLTAPDNVLRVPRIFFADTNIDRNPEGQLANYLPYVDKPHIEDCLRELENNPAKLTKTVDRNPPLLGFFNTIASGFYVGDPSETYSYAFPSRDVLERDHHQWWRSAAIS